MVLEVHHSPFFLSLLRLRNIQNRKEDALPNFCAMYVVDVALRRSAVSQYWDSLDRRELELHGVNGTVFALPPMEYP